MKSRRLLNHRLTDLKPFILIFLIGVLGFLIWRVAPSNSIIISLFITTTTYSVYLAASFVTSKTIQLIATLFIFLFLILNYIVGFDIINTLLLLSFIIALSKLVIRDHKKEGKKKQS